MKKFFTGMIFLMLLFTGITHGKMSINSNYKFEFNEEMYDDWHMFHHDNQHTGFTSAKGNIINPKEVWSYSTGGAIKSSCAIGNLNNNLAGMNIVVGSSDGYIYATDSNGNKMKDQDNQFIVIDVKTGQILNDDAPF